MHSARRSSVGDRRVQSRALTASPSASWTVRSPDECTLVSESRFLLKPGIDNEGGLAQSRCCRLLAWAKDGTTGGASERSWSLSVLSALIVEPFPKVYYEVCFCLKKNSMIITCASMQRPRLLLPGLLPRAVRPQQLALPQLREKSCDTLVLHGTIMSLHVRQLHVSQLHAVDMRAQTRAQPR